MFTSQQEKIFFLSHINNTQDILEYGSGESTLEIAKLCKKIVSVEHQYVWYEKLKSQLPSNCIALYHPPNKTYQEGGDCGSIEQFYDYVYSPMQYKPFDIILIDGRARVACSSVVSQMVKDQNSLIFIHDYNRSEYTEVTKFLNLVDICETMAKFKVKTND